MVNTYAQNKKTPPYKNPKLSIDKRVEDLISRMTVEEKVYQMCALRLGEGDEIFKTKGNYAIDHIRKQAVSLRSFPLFRSAVPVGRRQKKPSSSVPQALRIPKKIRQSRKRRDNLIFSAARSSSSHAHFLRSVGLMQP